jgi:RNA polymerase sigma-70 factor, ECF subfamily
MSESEASSTIANTTSVGLLDRARHHDSQAWQRLVDLYGPLIHSWSRRWPLQHADRADLLQEVFQAVAAGLGGFAKRRSGDRFRGWLWTITRNKAVTLVRRRLTEPDALGGSEARSRWAALPAPNEDADWQPPAEPSHAQVVGQALRLIRPEFQDRTWQAFWQVAVEARSPDDVAADLGLSRMAVYKAKSRVLCRLRRRLDGLPD